MALRDAMMRRAQAIALAACLGAPFAAAADVSLFEEGAHLVLFEQVNAAQSGEYRRILAELDAYLAQHPQDAIATVERCQFIDALAYASEDGDADAYEASEKCREDLRTGPHARTAAVRVYLWRNSQWDANTTAEGEALLKEAGTWTLKQRAALHEGLSYRYQQGNPVRAREHAALAFDLDPQSTLRLSAAEYYATTGAAPVAVAIIESMPAKLWEGASLKSAVSMLLDAGDVDAARRVIEEHTDIDLPPQARFELAGRLISAGERDTGRALVAGLTGGSPLPEQYGPWLDSSIFRFQLEHGSAAEAAAAYRKLRDGGLSRDPLGWRRLALTATHWSAPWRWSDIVGLGALLGLLVLISLAPGIVLVPVHYRSAVKRAHGFLLPPLSPESPWTLRSAWYALAACIAVSLCMTYVFAYPVLESGFSEAFGFISALEPQVDDRVLGRVMLAYTVLCIVVLLPMLRGLKWRTILLGQWPVVKSVLIGAAFAVVALLVHSMIRLLADGETPAVEQGMTSDTVRAIRGMHAAYGALTALLCVGILVPMIEEFVYRGVLLRSMARHINIWLVIVLQALVFMMAHEISVHYAGHFVFGVLAGWMAWRSGGLIGPLTMHAANNTLVSLVLFNT